MPKKDSVTIYTIPSFVTSLQLEALHIRTVAFPIQKMVKRFMDEGRENDICIMPYVTQYKSLLTTFRANNLLGPVFFISDESVDSSIKYDIHKQGAILVDARNQQKDFVKLMLVFIIEHKKMMKFEKHARPLTENEQAAEAIHNFYPQKLPEPESRDLETTDNSDSETSRPAIAKVLEQPEILIFEQLYGNKDLFEEKFSFNFDITRKKDNQKLSFSCMTRLSGIEVISSSTKKRMMFFSDFNPDFSITFFRRLVTKVTKEDIAQALESQDDEFQNSSKVECLFSLGGVKRTCFMLPSIKRNDDTIGFIPISNAFIQNRQFFRIEPSKNIPMKALVSSTLSITKNVNIIDISERGLSFYSSDLFKNNSKVSMYLAWGKNRLICHGIVRFSNYDEVTANNIIGVELYLHRDERAKLRRYVFDCQIETMKTLREEYAI